MTATAAPTAVCCPSRHYLAQFMCTAMVTLTVVLYFAAPSSFDRRYYTKIKRTHLPSISSFISPAPDHRDDGSRSVLPTNVRQSPRKLQSITKSEYLSLKTKTSTRASDSCSVEMLAATSLEVPLSVHDIQCRRRLPQQGNYTYPWDVFRHSFTPALTVNLSASAADVAAYWSQERDNDPFEANCLPCEGQELHPIMSMARRWWAPLRVSVNSVPKPYLTHMVLKEDRFIFQSGPPPSPSDVSVTFHEITRCEVAADGIKLLSRDGGRYAWEWVLPSSAGTFQYSLNLLAPGISGKCAWTRPTPPFRYVPCVMKGEFDLFARAAKAGLMDVYKNRWNSNCAVKKPVTHETCGAVPKKYILGGVDGGPKVALAMSGFYRTFTHTKRNIYYYLQRANRADVFVATWNIIGRVKQGSEQHNMRRLTVDEMRTSIETQFKGVLKDIVVADYFDRSLAKYLDDIFMSGFYRPGNYYLTALALQLIPKNTYDAVIRTRLDIVPTMPIELLWFNPVNKTAAPTPDQRQLAVRVLDSCEIDGMWWPQYAALTDNKVVKHMADTRFRLYAWQTCDWIEVGTARAMETYQNVFNWSVANNIISFSQQVEFAFFTEHQISWQPMHLRVRILRRLAKKGNDFG